MIFVCGDDDAAKAQTVELLHQFGWPAERVMDLGGIVAARGTEMFMPLWLQMMQALDTVHFNITVASPHR